MRRRTDGTIHTAGTRSVLPIISAISEWYEHIESIHQRFGVEIPGEWESVIDSVQQAIAREREFIRDFDELEESECAQ